MKVLVPAKDLQEKSAASQQGTNLSIVKIPYRSRGWLRADSLADARLINTKAFAGEGLTPPRNGILLFEKHINNMATKNHNLSEFDSVIPSAEDFRFGIVVSEWNNRVTGALLAGALKTLREAGCPDHNIIVKTVPGAFELSLGAQYFAEYTEVDAVIALGCVIRGGTPHFDYVCQAATHGINQVQINWNMPVAFGLLTCDDEQQALDRAGGKYGNKGDEAAAAAVKMAKLQKDMEAASDKVDRTKIS